MTKGKIPSELIIVFLAMLCYLPFLGRVHLFDWDEINFAESAREMLASGEYTYVQINFEPFWEKPPLFIWIQAFFMKLFGVGEYSSRLPNAICGVFTLLSLFWIGKKEFNARFGWLWTIAHGASILPFLYFKSGIIDPWFNLFIFLGIYFGYRYLCKDDGKWKHVLLLGMFTGLSMLTKGPVGPLLVGLTGGIFWLVNWKKGFSIRIKDVLLGLLAFALTGGFWFFLQILAGRWDVVMDFLLYQVRLFQTKDAGHGGFFGYHAVVLLVGLFPASIFALGELFKKGVSEQLSSLSQIMKVCFWVVLILFSIVETKIVHYSSMAYFPISFLAAQYLITREKWTNWQLIILLFIGSILGIAVSSLAFWPGIQTYLLENVSIKDSFALEALKTEIHWGGYEFWPGIIILLGLVFVIWKRNYFFQSSRLIFGINAVFLFLTLTWVVPQVEKFSQGAAIEFFESKAQEDCYLVSFNYKSYVPYFYGKVPPGQSQESKDKFWLLMGEIDKPVYLSSKIKYKDRLMEVQPELEYLYGKNGFIFFVRNPKKAR
ncbi:MAG: glycosyltransferase family 39 protein [Bacteroidia bacterium]|nr:glycosyltransferase family 39 protein [Bacteroidia bacterium]